MHSGSDQTNTPASGQTAEQAEDAHLGHILVNNQVAEALTPQDSPSVAATVTGLIQGLLGGGGGK